MSVNKPSPSAEKDSEIMPEWSDMLVGNTVTGAWLSELAMSWMCVGTKLTVEPFYD